MRGAAAVCAFNVVVFCFFWLFYEQDYLLSNVIVGDKIA